MHGIQRYLIICFSPSAEVNIQLTIVVSAMEPKLLINMLQVTLTGGPAGWGTDKIVTQEPGMHQCYRADAVDKKIESHIFEGSKKICWSIKEGEDGSPGLAEPSLCKYLQIFSENLNPFPTLFCLVLMCEVVSPLPFLHKTLINISWKSVLIFARVCCQVATFSSAARKENISQQTQQRNLGQPSQTQINVALKDQPAGAHHCLSLCAFIFPAMKCQILNKTGSIICSEDEWSTSAH